MASSSTSGKNPINELKGSVVEYYYPYPSHVNARSFVSVELSGEHNYVAWKDQMTCLLDSHDMLGFIDGTIINQPQTNISREWKRSDMLVKGWIYGSLSEDVMQTVVGLQTANHVWTELRNIYTTPPPPPVVTATNKKDVEEYVPLYRAIEMGDWEKAQEFFNEDQDALIDELEADGTRALHVAVGDPKNISILEKLLDRINPDSLPTLVDIELQNALHSAAVLDNKMAAMKLVGKNPNLLFIADRMNYLPIQRAILNAHKTTFLYLLQVCKQHIGLSQKDGSYNPFEGERGAFIVISTIFSGFFDIALDLLKEYPELARTKTNNFGTPLSSIANMWEAYPSAKHYNFYQRFVYSHVGTHYCLGDRYKIHHDIENQETYSSNLVNKCMKSYIYPAFQRIYVKFWEVAVLHVPHMKHIYEEKVKHNTAIMILKSICEEVAKLRSNHYDHYGDAFIVAVNNNTPEEVSKFMRPSEREAKNNEQETPIMVFRESHKALRKEGEEWMKKTADSYTITAALIITIVFAAAITVPGGTNGDNGKPFYETKSSFIIFAVSDAISLFTSTTSLLLFLSILTARYAEEDFLYKLPLRLILGLVMLFMSVTTMMIAFSATLYIMFAQGKLWILIPVAALTCLPIASFVTLQLPLLVDLISSTYGRGIFGKRSELRITS